MPLAVTHRGWENEHLATFLLSRLAFVASPKTVADDVGTDLFCTLYEHATRDGVAVLVPRSSIAVQIKSAPEPIDITARLDYFERLEIPYYVGVVDQRLLSLELYSARFLPAVLSLAGRPKRLRLKPVNAFERHYRRGDNESGYELLCHKVVTLRAHDDHAATSEALALLAADAAAGLTAIASRLNKEYIFEIPGGDVEIFMGPGSAATFRQSFFKRLAEALLNLAWQLEVEPPEAEEVNAYLEIVGHLSTTVAVPGYVIEAREVLLRKRDERWPPASDGGPST